MAPIFSGLQPSKMPAHPCAARSLPVRDKLFAAVLAAGSASRFGRTKQLQVFRGRTLVHHAMRLAENTCGNRSLLVTGHDGPQVAAACRPLAGFFVHNEHYETGLGSSLACAVRAVQHTAGALLILLADQPRITPEHLRVLASSWQASPDRIVASRYAGVAGPPVIFPRQYFPELAELSGDPGARRVILGHKDKLMEINFEDAALDIDYPQDLDGLD